MLQALTAGALFLSSLAAPVTASTPAMLPPPADKIVIDVAAANGSGCPLGTTSVLVSPDNTAFTVIYSDYHAQVGGDSASDAFRRNCQLVLNVHVPQGLTYAISKTDYRGYAQLQRGATAYQKASYYFQGDSHTARAQHNFSGPLNGDWQTTDVVGIAALVWAPCGAKRFFNINTELRADLGWSKPSDVSLIAMDSTDMEIGTVYHLSWKSC